MIVIVIVKWLSWRFIALEAGGRWFGIGCAYLGYGMLAIASHAIKAGCILTSLRLDLSGTSEGSVNLTHDCG